MESGLFTVDLANCPAHQEMARQHDLGVDYRYSLDSLWRAAGSPAGKKPKEWLHWAQPLVSGVALYFARADRRQGVPNPSSGAMDDVVSMATDTDPDGCWEQGDTLAAFVLAEIYARHLDYAEPGVAEPAGGPPRLMVFR